MRPAIPSAVLYWAVEVARVVAASDVPPAGAANAASNRPKAAEIILTFIVTSVLPSR